ncbi:MAG TPA: biotin--protein ligase [Cyanobacteria bacterium UBA11149]|nr:biotin--protein ligase [Cyanobacteria bacterium UBA11367]HBE57569.1 biotin--protein ligase [Cyanobacteria bacterium UBA11366]HBR73297.1 biotin--protein ligase [Cyanobacteria bacterium UBA11159]HBS67755.1 biotin--protein ligase [Cyanobacteria bacterium UBA11153]HBW92034.1 biotin--protein ligase [Cyanobacteria bacterium UBA11149]HCA97966.1 biotin--protein ligase [Cyanobacteria bacterium UBA9226]
MNWRLIPLLNLSGKLQMAIDEWLFAQHCLGKQSPVLRFYTWEFPTISLGYHQRRWPSFWQDLTWQEMPISIVRRPTGGRAVLHQGDLTYMVITSGLTGKRNDSYQKICEFLMAGLRSQGIDLYYGLAGRDYIRNPNCFATATGADLVLANGTKLIGSAQLRRGDAILQHGSIRLQPDGELFTTVFGETIPPVSFAGLTGNFLTGETLIETLVESLTNAAADCFGVNLVNQPLSDTEWERILAQPSLEVGLPVGIKN